MDIVKLSNKLRFRVIQMSFETKAPHLASSLSCIDIIATLYENVLKIKANNPKWESHRSLLKIKTHVRLFTGVFDS